MASLDLPLLRRGFRRPAYLVRAAVLALRHGPQRAQCLVGGLIAPGLVHERFQSGRVVDATEKLLHLDEIVL